MIWSWLVFVVLFAAGHPAAAAAEPADPPSVRSAPSSEDALIAPSRVPEVSVSLHTIPAQVTVITAEEIAQSGATTIQEVLQQAGGVMVFDTLGFGLGSDSTVNLRGVVNSSRTNALVLVDGVRQNRITGDDVHWPSIPLSDIERIEIVHGGGGLIYGEGAFAGVIQIITKHDAPKPLETEAGVEVGSFGWQRYRLAGRGRIPRLTYGATYDRHLVTGYREFSKSRSTTVTSHTGAELGALARLRVDVLHSEDTTGFAGGLSPHESQDRRRQAVISRAGIFDDETNQVSTDLVLGPWQGASAVVNLYWRDRTSDSLRSRLFTLAPSRGLSVRTVQDWRTDRVNNFLASGLELTDDKATTGTRGSPPEDESNRAGYGLYLEDTVTLADRVSLVGGVRFDKYRYQESISFPSFEGTLRFKGFSPKAGVVVVVIPNQLDAFASYSRPFKAPNVDDFSAQVPDFAGNVDLQPQQADTYEVGSRWTHPYGDATLTWFWSRTDDEILFNRLGGSFGQNQNFDTQRTGVELGTRLRWQDRLRGSLHYSLINAEFYEGQFAGNRLPGTPRHYLTASAGVSPYHDVWLDLRWWLVNDRVRINDFANALPKGDNFGVLDLTLQARYRNARLFITLQNLTNTEYSAFESSNATNLLGAGENPMPPFGVVSGLTLTF